MSKHIRHLLILLLAAILVAAGMVPGVTSAVSMAQRPRSPRKAIAPSVARNAAIIATTSSVLIETSEIRELPVLRPVKSGARSRSEIERMLVHSLDQQITPAEMHASELALRKFGLVPSTFELRPFTIKLLTEQVAGYYDPKAKEFHLADWLDLEGQKPVMAHELAHALQDQHFNLRRFVNWPHGDADAEMAAHALMEGDAMVAMTKYMLKYPMIGLAFRRSIGGGISTEQYDLAPRSIRESLIFPYWNGAEFITQLYRRGGWAAVSKAYTNLPLSTEQILHPEKYFSYERPVKVALPDVSGLLNSGQRSAVSNQPAASAGVQLPPPPSKKSALRNRSLPTANRPQPTTAWRRIDSNVNGEWSYYLLLDEFLKSSAESKRAAAGWAGDRYDVYEGPAPGDVFIAHLSVWDTENDAREFFEAYAKRTNLRYPEVKRVDSSESQPESGVSGDGDKLVSWTTGEGLVVIQLRGVRVLVLEGMPEGIDANALRKSLRGQ